MSAFRPVSQSTANLVSFATVIGVVVPLTAMLILVKPWFWAAWTATGDPTALLWDAGDTPFLAISMAAAFGWALLANRLVQDGRLGAWSASIPIARPWRLVKVVTLALLAVSLICAGLAVWYGHVVYRDRIVFSGALPGMAHRTVPLSLVREIETGCATRTDFRRSIQRPIYRLILADGSRVELDRARFDMGHAAWLKGLAALDGEVRRLGIPRRPSLDRDGRPERTTACVAHFDRRHTPGQSADFHQALELIDPAPSR